MRTLLVVCALGSAAFAEPAATLDFKKTKLDDWVLFDGKADEGAAVRDLFKVVASDRKGPYLRLVWYRARNGGELEVLHARTFNTRFPAPLRRIFGFAHKDVVSIKREASRCKLATEGPCTKLTYAVRTGGQDATMVVRIDPRIPGPGIYDTEAFLGKIRLWQLEVVGYGTGDKSAWGAAAITKRLPHKTDANDHGLPYVRLTAQATGGRGALEIEHLLERHTDKLKDCYERELARRPALEGNIVAKLDIDAAGAVTTSTATGFDPAVATCVRGAFEAIPFGKAKDGKRAQVSVEIRFVED